METTKPKSQAKVYRFLTPSEMEKFGVTLKARPGSRGATGTRKETAAIQLQPAVKR
jgi:hypothetical protein